MGGGGGGAVGPSTAALLLAGRNWLFYLVSILVNIASKEKMPLSRVLAMVRWTNRPVSSSESDREERGEDGGEGAVGERSARRIGGWTHGGHGSSIRLLRS